MSIKIGIGKLRIGTGGSQSWDAAANYISGLTVETTSSSEQTITAIITGTDYDGVSFEYSTDNVTFTEQGTSATGTYNATGLVSDTIYYWRARLYKGSQYGDYCVWDYEKTSPHANLIAGWRFDELVSMEGTSPAAFQLYNSESAIYYNGKTYVVYQGDDRDPYIFTYTHATGVFSTPVKIGTNPLSNGDYSHGSPGMIIDDAGYIHVMYGCHGSNIQYAKSNNSEDISAWTAQSTLGTGTYTQLIKFSNGDIYVFYRSETAPTCNWGYRKSSDNGVNWDAYVSLSVDFAYLKFVKGISDIVHICSVGNNVTSIDRFNLHYFTFDGTTLKNISGVSLTIPIDITDAANILVKDSGLNYIPASTLGIDATDKPYIFFTEGIIPNATATYNYKIAKHTGTSWNIISTGSSAKNAYAYASAIDVIDSSNIDIYVITKGTALITGGNIEQWKSTDSGDSWTRYALLQYGIKYTPVLVRDYDNDAKLIIQSIESLSITDDVNPCYLWGSGGIINNYTGSRMMCKEIKNTYIARATGYIIPIVGVSGNAIKISTAISYLELVDNDVFSFAGGSPDKPFTVTLWINVANTVTNQFIFYKQTTNQEEYRMYVGGNVLAIICYKLGQPAVYIAASAPYITVNEWKFIAFSYDGSGNETGLKVYINCLESQTAQVKVGAYLGMTNGTKNVTIGQCASNIDRSLDEVKVWNKVLSPAEMAAEMANTL